MHIRDSNLLKICFQRECEMQYGCGMLLIQISDYKNMKTKF